MKIEDYKGLEQHHVKYLERDGEDEIILVTHKEHKQIHRELKAQGILPVTREVIEAARKRSPGCKVTAKKYAQSDVGKAKAHKYREDNKLRIAAYKKQYRLKHLKERREYNSRYKNANREEENRKERERYARRQSCH